MNLSKIKKELTGLSEISFQLPNGELVPEHFHVTEVGKITKNFIDCGGTVRKEEVVNFQLWNANDYNHRLHPEKLVKIIELSQQTLNISDDLEIEVEYQGESIEKYGLDFNGGAFLLTTKQTDCLVKDNCGIPNSKPKLKLADLNESVCDPNGNCC
ncbi:DUF6428 family protein [Marivirga arenosa]|uniref:DUF6428 family protein n=1 Tax=Marivirga arenosa TaxID=3059076 RepID=A0AA51RD91_9BACT|nr:DUF6428 family protein [Marivirga sp. ABR2-2]WMN07549.1 DUF6428 family protein [Marivirga sp. ABR2-2]